jgi:hypothetical protein
MNQEKLKKRGSVTKRKGDEVLLSTDVESRTIKT